MSCLHGCSTCLPSSDHHHTHIQATGVPDPNALQPHALPEITLEQLDAMIPLISQEVDRLDPGTSSTPISQSLSNMLAQWEGQKQMCSSFLNSVNPKDLTDEVAGNARSLFMPLLTKDLGGVGGVHWLGVGFAFIAWSLDNINNITQNREDCINILRGSLRLLRNTKQIWQATNIDNATGIEDDLRDSVEKAFRCAFFCTFTLTDAWSLRILKATTVKDAIAMFKRELDRANIQNIEFIVRNDLLKAKVDFHDDIVGELEVAREAMPYLREESSDIIAVCLHGMGGIGKSIVGHEIFKTFETGKGLQEGIKYRNCRVEMGFGIDLKDIQKQILEKVCRQSTPAFSNTFDGREVLQKKLNEIKEPIFLYLDNVVESKDLLEILPQASYFPQGSRILVTSRGTHVKAGIEKLGIRELNIKLFEVQGLQEDLARELLWKQIRRSGQHKLDAPLKKLEEEVLKLCDGLPLALKVVGGYIASDEIGPKNAKVWQHVVNSMQKAQPLIYAGWAKDELYLSIKFSIDNLHEDVKKSFLDIVLFYDVDDLWKSIKCLVGCNDLKVLKERALVHKSKKTSIDFKSHIEIHGVLKAIGLKMITDDKNELRISGTENFDNALKEYGHNNALLRKVVALKDVTLEASLLNQMPNLRFLKDVKVEGQGQDAQLRHLAVVYGMRSRTGKPFNFGECTALKELRWDDAAVDVSNLEVLRHEEVSKGLERLTLQRWEELENVDVIETFHSLKMLRLTGCRKVEFLPQGIGSMGGLRELQLDSLGLRSLPLGIVCLTGLKRLSLSFCQDLHSLPEGISSLSALKVLDMCNCENLHALPESVATLTHLTHLMLRVCKRLQALPEGVGNLIGLTDLDFYGCSMLEALPKGIANLTGLTKLSFQDCDSLTALPDGVSKLIGLTSLDMSGCDRLQCLPDEITKLKSLNILNLTGCGSLKQLPKGFVGLQELRLKGCVGIESAEQELACLKRLSKLEFSCRDSLLPQEISMLDLLDYATLQSKEGITTLAYLESLSLQDCERLQRLPQGLSRLANLTSLQAYNCKSLGSIPHEMASLTKLTVLRLTKCYRLVSLPQGIGSLRGLTQLDLELCISLETLSEEVITGLTSLTELQLSHCASLNGLPEALSKATGLMELNLEFCESLRALPDAVANLTCLTHLKLRGCKRLQALPEGVGNLIGLTDLDFYGCSSLRALPQGIANLTGLTKLSCQNCGGITELPEGVSKLIGLTSLDMSGCDRLQRLPEQITKLKSLNILNLSGCGSLKELPKGFVGLQELNLKGCVGIESALQELACLECLSKLEFSSGDRLLPQEIPMMTCLIQLQLSECAALQSIEGITTLVCLNSLSLQECERLQRLPQGLSRLTNLTSLQASHCESLESIPDEMESLTNLTELSLVDCTSLKSLPQGMGSLRQLDLKWCTSMETLSDEVITSLTSLRKLELSHCGSLKRLPEALSELTGLEELDLTHCRSLEWLPGGIARLTGLKKLRFGGCSNLRSLPKEIGSMAGVEWLELYGCRGLQALPDTLAGMQGLKEMDLTDCTSLQSLPQGITKLTGLEALRLQGCVEVLKSLPQGLMGLKELSLERDAQALSPKS